MRSMMFFLLLVQGLMLAALALAMPQGAFGGPLPLDSPREPVPATDFSALTPDGRTVNLSDYRGKVVLLNFWATWCPPCKYELPGFQRLHKDLAGRPFQLLTVDVGEDVLRVQAFLKRHNYTFTVALDPQGEVSRIYGAESLPLTYVIDKDGRILHRAIGARDWDGEAARKLLSELMEVPPASPFLSLGATSAPQPPLVAQEAGASSSGGVAK